jgi:hypothetical protein
MNKRGHNIVVELDEELLTLKVPLVLRLKTRSDGTHFATIGTVGGGEESIFAEAIVMALEQYAREIGALEPEPHDEFSEPWRYARG